MLYRVAVRKCQSVLPYLPVRKVRSQSALVPHPPMWARPRLSGGHGRPLPCGLDPVFQERPGAVLGGCVRVPESAAFLAAEKSAALPAVEKDRSKSTLVHHLPM